MTLDDLVEQIEAELNREPSYISGKKSNSLTPRVVHKFSQRQHAKQLIIDYIVSLKLATEQ